MILWIVTTDQGEKRTWAASRKQARLAAEKRGLIVEDIRHGTPHDTMEEWVKRKAKR